MIEDIANDPFLERTNAKLKVTVMIGVGVIPREIGPTDCVHIKTRYCWSCDFRKILVTLGFERMITRKVIKASAAATSIR